MPKQKIAGVLAIAMLLTSPALALETTHWIVRPHAMGSRTIGELRIGAGIACYSNGAFKLPPSYLVADIGKPGVPALSKADARILHEQFSHLAPRLLRFAYVPHARRHLVVFLASPQALCDPEQTSFKDLTGACNEYYEPLEYGDATIAAPDCF